MDDARAALQDAIARTWGYRSFRPLQEPAMRAVLERRDSLVVLPTGGGKSLCYQAPALLQNTPTVVVSPLIALMQDQVASLRELGVPAAALHSNLSSAEANAAVADLRAGKLKLLYASPERLTLSGFQGLLVRAGVRTFAVDEAHCISHWGHDFRPEYRQLARLRETFPGASVHAYTATATEQVRADIATQLGLTDHEILVGDFDRPNLTYRVVPRNNLLKQVNDVLARHQGEAGIIYCFRRKDVDELTASLRSHGRHALAYHAGLSPEQRHDAQAEFLAERCDLIVATVAFGMGIDRPNLRYVLHASMPKSIEHYAQEAGRAGRDGLPSECVLFFSGGDFMSLKAMVEQSAAEARADPAFTAEAVRHLDQMNRYCRAAGCRHRALVEHFGQAFRPGPCGHCDVCLGEVAIDPDSTVMAQKILSCVARVQEGFGVGHIASVLRGENTEAVRRRSHEKLSTFGLLTGVPAAQVRDWVYQLLQQGLLLQAGDEYPILKLTPASWAVMRGERPAQLTRPKKQSKQEKAATTAKAQAEAWDGVDRTLFDALRSLRRQLAEERQVPPYVVFGDATLRELARTRPTTLAAFRNVYGVGDHKLRDYGEAFVQAIKDFTGGVRAGE